MMEIYGLNGGLSKHSAAAAKSAPVLLNNAINIPYASAMSDENGEGPLPQILL